MIYLPHKKYENLLQIELSLRIPCPSNVHLNSIQSVYVINYGTQSLSFLYPQHPQQNRFHKSEKEVVKIQKHPTVNRMRRKLAGGGLFGGWREQRAVTATNTKAQEL